MISNFLFWWSVISTIIGIFLLCASIWQFLEARNSAARSKAQVKLWMQDANALQQSLTRIVQDNLDKRYTSTNDMANAIWTIHAPAFALYQSLYEERSITEEEYVAQQKVLQDELKKTQALGNISTSTSPSKTKSSSKKTK